MIKIMVDSASDCRSNEIYDIFVPLSINLDGEEYLDGINLDNDTFYNLLPDLKEFPRTSQPSPDEFLKLFEEAKQKGDSVIYFALSSALSGTYQSANIAKELADYDEIHIIDTKNITHTIGILCVHAKRLIENGLTAKEIVLKCEELKQKIKILAGLDTLEYLKKGGRIGKASALIGSLANIKPLVTVTDEGAVGAVGKALGFGKAVEKIVEKVKGFEIDPDFPLYSIYTSGEENCIKLEEKLKENGINITDRLQVGSTIGSHVGTGVYGVILVEK